MQLQNVEKEYSNGSLSKAIMSEKKIKVTFALICAVLFAAVVFSSVSRGGVNSPQVAVIDRIVDTEFIVFLIGPDEVEWILPTSHLQHDGVFSQHLVEGAWGQLQITECWGDPCVQPPFFADPVATREAYDRITAKLDALRARGMARFAVDRAAAADPSSR